jgi:hypothetical protein
MSVGGGSGLLRLLLPIRSSSAETDRDGDTDSRLPRAATASIFDSFFFFLGGSAEQEPFTWPMVFGGNLYISPNDDLLFTVKIRIWTDNCLRRRGFAAARGDFHQRCAKLNLNVIFVFFPSSSICNQSRLRAGKLLTEI